MSRRRRLIERDDNDFNTQNYADPVNAVAHSTPLRSVQSPQNTPYRSTNNVYAGGTSSASNAVANNYAGVYDAASGSAYDATNANGAFNTTVNADGHINEAAGGYSMFNAAANDAYDQNSADGASYLGKS